MKVKPTRKRVLGRVGGVLLDALMASTRYEVQRSEPLEALRGRGQPVIFVLWHGRLLPLAYLHRAQGIVALISRSGDGEYITGVLERWGYVPVRGSSSRGGTAALRELVRLGRAGRSIAVTPDGPRGPRQTMKPGPLIAAQLTGMPVLPIAAGTRRAWWAESWDRFLVPKPFATIHVAYGEPTFVPREADEAEIERLARVVEGELNRLVAEVDARAAADR